MVDKSANDGKPKGLPPLADDELKMRMELAEIEEDLIAVRLSLEHETSDAKIEKLEEEQDSLQDRQSKIN